MWRPLRNTFPSVLIGVAACVFLAGMALAYLIALPLPEWASDRIEAAISDHLPVDVMASEGFSLTLGQSPDTLAVGVDRVIIREQKTAMDVTLEETVLAIRILDLLRGTFAIESIAIGHLDWQQTTTDQSGNGAGQVSNGRWNPGEAVLDVRPAVRWLDQIKGRLDRLTIERFSSEFYLPHAAKALVLDGSFTVSGSSAGWQGVLRGEVKHDASRIGDIEGTFTIDGTDRHPEIVVMMMSDTAALAPFLNRPAVIPDVQFSTRLSPVWDHNSRLTGIAFVFEGAGDSWAPAGSSGNGLSRSGSVNSGSSADASLVLEGVYQWQSGVIELENLSLVVPEAELAGSGTMLIDFSDSGVLQGLSGSAHIETVQLRTDRFHHELLQPVEGSLTFALDAGAKRNHFMEFEFASAATGGRVTYEANGDQADEVSVHVDALMVEKMIALWPEGVFDNTRRWLATAIIGGRVSDFNGLFKIPQAGPMASQMSFQFRDLDFTPIRGHLPVM
ncbi:MAG: hypothetical protein OXC91_05090, partial [Rhodobacteraceae bacterium]|nr:hypothetical protein [Paracoccaceae bacterium]